MHPLTKSVICVNVLYMAIRTYVSLYVFVKEQSKQKCVKYERSCSQCSLSSFFEIKEKHQKSLYKNSGNAICEAI